MGVAALPLERVRELARSALANLETNRRRIDDLNVYPVPDGDTGTNLTLTVRAVVAAIDATAAETPAALASEITRAALLGSRGNSGVILSQIVRGFADVAGSAEEVDPAVLALAFRSASDSAYAALREPVEGTILTMIRELAEAAERLAPESSDNAELLEALVSAGEDSLARTPELLEKLRAAGVVDAGGAGLVEIVRGVAAAVAGHPIAELAAAGDTAGVDAIHLELSRYRYCTTYVVIGADLDAAALEHELGAIGDSLLVVGDPSALKVHVHTDDHAAAIALGARLGEVLEQEVADMHEQTREREARLAAVLAAGDLVTGVVAVVVGRGNREIFESNTGVLVVEGGPSMNPATADLLAAIEHSPAAAVVILPNDPNVILSAEQAVAQASKPARVIPTRSIAAGWAALSRYVSTLSLDTVETAMVETLGAIAVGAVTRASRAATVDGVEVESGQWLGLVDGVAVAAADDFETVARSIVEQVLDRGREPLQLIVGEDDPGVTELADTVRTRHPGLEVFVDDGGQPHYPLLLVAG